MLFNITLLIINYFLIYIYIRQITCSFNEKYVNCIEITTYSLLMYIFDGLQMNYTYSSCRV